MLTYKTMRHKYTFILGLEITKDGKYVDESTRAERRDLCSRLVASAFGGCTTTEVRGIWTDSNGRVIAERGVQIVAYSDMHVGISPIAEEMLKITEQSALVLEYTYNVGGGTEFQSYTVSA